MADPIRIEINVPAGQPQLLVKTVNADGSDADVPFRLISTGESEAFSFEPGQHLTIEERPEKDPS